MAFPRTIIAASRVILSGLRDYGTGGTFCLSLFGQLTEATIKGSAIDSTESTVSGSTVSARNEATGLVRTTLTTASGAFLIAGISPGLYTITVAAKGFKAFERKGLALSVGQTPGLDVRLQVVDAATEVQADGGDEYPNQIRHQRI